MSDETLSLRHIVRIAIEGLPGSLRHWVQVSEIQTMREHVWTYVDDYTRRRGVIFERAEVLAELDEALIERGMFTREQIDSLRHRKVIT